MSIIVPSSLSLIEYHGTFVRLYGCRQLPPCMYVRLYNEKIINYTWYFISSVHEIYRSSSNL